MKIHLKAYCYLALAMAIVGSSVVVGRIITDMFPVFLATGLSLLMAVIIMVPLLLFKYGFPRLSKKDYLVLLSQAFFGIFLFRVFLLYGLRFIDAGHAGIITSSIPAVIALISYLFLKEKIGMRKGLGIAVTVLGILLMQAISSSNNQQANNLLLGGFLIFGSVVGEALFSILAKFLPREVKPFTIATSVAVFGLVLTLPFAVYQSLSFDFNTVTNLGWLAIVYYGIFLTVITFFLWFKGLKEVDASTAGVFTGFIPISSVGLAYLLLGQPINFSHIIGTAFVICGIVLIAKK